MSNTSDNILNFPRPRLLAKCIVVAVLFKPFSKLGVLILVLNILALGIVEDLDIHPDML